MNSRAAGEGDGLSASEGDGLSAGEGDGVSAGEGDGLSAGEGYEAHVSDGGAREQGEPTQQVVPVRAVVEGGAVRGRQRDRDQASQKHTTDTREH